MDGQKEKNRCYRAYTEIWGLMKETGFCALSDEEWEGFIDRGKEILQSAAAEMDEELFRDMFLAVTKYYERQRKHCKYSGHTGKEDGSYDRK